MQDIQRELDQVEYKLTEANGEGYQDQTGDISSRSPYEASIRVKSGRSGLSVPKFSRQYPIWDKSAPHEKQIVNIQQYKDSYM